MRPEAFETASQGCLESDGGGGRARGLTCPLMSTAQPLRQMSYPEYVEFEATSADKHEFVNGEVYSMAGGTLEHAALAMAVGGELRLALAGKPCRVLSADARVHVLVTHFSAYPDLSVVCGKQETAAGDPHALLNPVVLVEVLSDATEAYDRGAKAAHYRQIPSLKEYVLVSQGERRIEVQRRNPQGIWEIHWAEKGQKAHLVSLEVELEVDAIYENPLEG